MTAMMIVSSFSGWRWQFTKPSNHGIHTNHDTHSLCVVPSLWCQDNTNLEENGKIHLLSMSPLSLPIRSRQSRYGQSIKRQITNKQQSNNNNNFHQVKPLLAQFRAKNSSLSSFPIITVIIIIAPGQVGDDGKEERLHNPIWQQTKRKRDPTREIRKDQTQKLPIFRVHMLSEPPKPYILISISWRPTQVQQKIWNIHFPPSFLLRFKGFCCWELLILFFFFLFKIPTITTSILFSLLQFSSADRHPSCTSLQSRKLLREEG